MLLGDCIAMLNLQYGDPLSIETTEEIYKWLALNSYESSIQLAKERGAFPVWRYEKEKDHPFLSRIYEQLTDKTRDDLNRAYGGCD